MRDDCCDFCRYWHWGEEPEEPGMVPLGQCRRHAPRHVLADFPERLEKVQLIGLAAQQDSAIGSERQAWTLRYGEGETDGSELPSAIFDRLEGMTTSPTDAWNLGIAVYPNGQTALDALSRACVAWGRELAGLPPLTAGHSP